MGEETAAQLQGRLAITVRHHPERKAEIEDLRRRFREAQTAEGIERLVATAPPLSEATRARLANLLRPS